MLQENPPFSKPCILAVDDEPANLKLIEMILDDMDLEVTTTSSPAEAIAFTREREFALLLLDVNMPRINGFKCLQEIRKNQACKHTPAVFLTANQATDADIKQGYDSGAVDYLVKPIDQQIFKHKVSSLVNLHEARRHAEKEVETLSSKFRDTEKLLNQSTEGVLAFDEEFHVSFSNSAAAVLLNQTPKNLTGKHIKDFIEPSVSDQDWETSEFVSIFQGDQDGKQHNAIFRRDNEEVFPVLYTISKFSETPDRQGGIIFFTDNSEKKELEEKLRHLAHYDSLTELPNRTHFFETLTRAITQSKASSLYVAVMIFDINNFKEINTNYGHQCGDLLLKTIAGELKDKHQHCGLIARIGGDQFVILLKEIEDPSSISAQARIISSNLNKKYLLNGEYVTVNVRMGISVFPTNGGTPYALLRNAELAMHQAKASTDKQFLFFSKELEKLAETRNFISKELKNAIDDNQMQILYQPQISFIEQEISGAEALVRWHHPEKGIISPANFIPIAEKLGIIPYLTAWLVENVCKQLKAWENFIKHRESFSVSVNISTLDLEDEGFARKIKDIMDREEIPYHRIHIEVTETSVMEDCDLAIRILQEFRDLGMGIAVDDFGTGYSSLSYLNKLPIDLLKIDRAFVENIGIEPGGESIANSIIQLANTLKLEVLAEGVETMEQFKYLAKRGCFRAQGYLFSPPLHPDLMLEMINNDNNAPGFFKPL